MGVRRATCPPTSLSSCPLLSLSFSLSLPRSPCTHLHSNASSASLPSSCWAWSSCTTPGRSRSVPRCPWRSPPCAPPPPTPVTQDPNPLKHKKTNSFFLERRKKISVKTHALDHSKFLWNAYVLLFRDYWLQGVGGRTVREQEEVSWGLALASTFPALGSSEVWQPWKPVFATAGFCSYLIRPRI